MYSGSLYSRLHDSLAEVDALQSPSHQDSLANQIKDLFTYPKGRAQSDEESCSSSGSSPSVHLHAVDDERPASRSSTESESDSDECHRAAGAAAVSSRTASTHPWTAAYACLKLTDVMVTMYRYPMCAGTWRQPPAKSK